MEISKSERLPAGIEMALVEYPKQGICVVFQDDKSKEWNSLGMDGSKLSRLTLTTIIEQNKFGDNATHFVIIGLNGNALYANMNIDVIKDENNFVHVDKDNYLVKIMPDVNDKCAYATGKNIEEINFKVGRWVNMGFIDKPADFTQNGFRHQPIPQSASQFGE